jgi:hypothetical protein
MSKNFFRQQLPISNWKFIFVDFDFLFFFMHTRGRAMDRPDLFLEGNQSFTNGIMELSRQVKRIADKLDSDTSGEAPTAAKKFRVTATRKVIYCLTDWTGSVSGPSYGLFFSEFSKSPEGKESDGLKGKNDAMQKVSLALTWLLNQPSSVLLSASHTGQCTVWTVQVDEPLQ